MVLCEMCGKDIENYFRAKLEGSTLKVCGDCAKYGQVLEKIEPEVVERKKVFVQKKRMRRIEQPVKERYIVPDYSKLIRDKRERMGLKQKEFAAKVSEKESIIQQLEQGKFEPSIKLAEKLERFLKVTLIEEYEAPIEEEEKEKTNTLRSVLTLGDMIKVRKRK
ncbi:multiprotein bridging factor aMBF1 [Nanoarchaeota archaeon]